MNFVNTGVREVGRRLRRQRNRLALINARKAVERAEIALGRAGWREMENDPALAASFERIHGHDTEIADANARVNALDLRLVEQEAVRAQARHEHEAAAQAIAAERAPVEQRLLDLQARLAEHGRALQEQNLKRNALHAGQTALLRQERNTRRQNLLLSEDERDARQREFDAGRSRLSEQAALLAAARSAEAEATAADQRGIKEVRNTLKGLDQRTHNAAAELAARERAVAMSIGALHKEIAAIRRQAARIEADKDGPLLAVGRALAAREQPPEGQEPLHTTARRHRQGFERLEALESQWLLESRNADRQDLRIFNFVWVTLAILVALALLLVFKQPGKRDWLPRNTEAILMLDVKNFTDADFSKALQAQAPDQWRQVWTGLVRTVADVPAIDVRKQVSRITRALAPATEKYPAVDCLLVEMRPFVDVLALRKQLLAGPGGFRQRPFNGLPIYETAHGLALAQIGPDTLIVGPTASVEALINVRLGLRDDLKSDAQVFNEFQRLDEDGAFRLVTYRPRDLTNLTDPLLDTALLGSCQALGLTINVRDPVSAEFLLNAANATEAGQIAKRLTANPDEVLQLQGVGPNLFIEPPTVKQHDAQVEWRFRMTATAARVLLERVSRLELASMGGRKVARTKP